MEPVSCALLGYLEILDKAGRVIQRTPVQGQTLRIGRAFDNDLILDDPYVCPYHVRLTLEEGQPRLTDLQSINGITDAAGHPLADNVSLAGGQVVHLGRTSLRFRSLDHSLPPTLPIARNRPLQFLLRPLCLWMVFLLTLGNTLLEIYMSTTEEFEPLKQAPVLLGILILVVLWSMLWSFASRIVSHRWNFWNFCGIACLGLLLSTLAETGIEYLCFALSLDKALLWTAYLAEFLVVGAVIYINLRLISAVSWILLARFAGGIALALVLVTWGVTYSQQGDFDSSPQYQVTLKAPFWKIGGSSSTEEFFKQGETLLDELDREREIP
ncbi:MAG: FHA domain-containing protein [Desulfuromonadaceae bacterium]|jgi:hypothetical protein